MSRAAYFEINYRARNLTRYSLVTALLDSGWGLEDRGVITFLPLQDQDYNWSFAGSEQKAQVLETVLKKDAQNEIIGIVLFWQDSQIGGQFLFFQESTVSINLTSDRSELANAMGFTDVNWYLMKLLPVFQNNAVQIESMTWGEHI